MESNFYLTLASTGLMVWTLAVFFLGKWYGRRARDRQLSAQSSSTRSLADSGPRVEAALDAIAEEVERIGEHQRFLTRKLSESTGEPPRPVDRE